MRVFFGAISPKSAGQLPFVLLWGSEWFAGLGDSDSSCHKHLTLTAWGLYWVFLSIHSDVTSLFRTFLAA